MNLKTRYNLWKLKRSLNPTSDFRDSLRNDVRQAWDAKYGSVHWYEFPLMHKAGFVAVIILLLTGAGGAYAYSSPQVTEGTPLYSIKQALELVEEKTKFTPEAKAEFFLKKIERREAEREMLKKRILPEIQKIKEIKVKLNKVTSSVAESETEIGVQLETEEKIRLNAAAREIRKTEKSIERAEEQLERDQKILEKIESKNIRLFEKVKARIEHRQERIKTQLESKIEAESEASDTSGDKVIQTENQIQLVSGTEHIKTSTTVRSEIKINAQP